VSIRLIWFLSALDIMAVPGPSAANVVIGIVKISIIAILAATSADAWAVTTTEVLVGGEFVMLAE
jgi:hypothetical protein